MIAVVACLLAAGPAVGEVRFVEVADAWGLSFRHRHGGRGDFYMIETMGSGVVVFDYDGDGDDDVLMIDSGGLPGADDAPATELFRNEGDSRFAPKADRADLRSSLYGMGGTAGDVDGDGDIDLYLTGFGSNELWINLGDGRFVERGEWAAVDDESWGMSAAFADADGDGDLDLYVTNYVDFAFDDNPVCGLQSRNLRSYCHPDVYDGLPDRFYLNRGDGSFEEATERAGFGEAAGKGLGVLFQDLGGDALPDVYVANDMTPNYLYRNSGDGRFEDVGVLSGVAFGTGGQPEAGMGVDAGDLTGDGRLELIVTHLDGQTNAVYSAVGDLSFVDRRFVTRVAEPSFYRVGFGVALADFDLDGHLDLAIANGHIVHNVDLWERGTTYRQPNQLLLNSDGAFVEAVAGLDVVRSSRGLAVGDLDGDGDLDLVVTNNNDLAEVYENASPGAGWLRVDVVNAAGSPAGVGGRVHLEQGGGRSQWRELRTGSSYLSQSSAGAYFGLDDVRRVDSIELERPGGATRRLLRPPADRRLVVPASRR